MRFYKPTKNTAIAFAAAAVLVGLDLLTKFFVVEYLKPLRSINLININNTQILNFTYAENTGAAFSSFEGMRWFLVGMVAVYVLAALFLILTRMVRRPFTVWSLCLVLAGGIGNGVGRVMDGYVVDFIDVRVINFAIFNLADMCAVVGAIALFISVLFDSAKEISQEISQEKSKEKSQANEHSDDTHE